MHVGIPVINKKPDMVYNEWGHFWVNKDTAAYDYKIEYLKFEEGSPLPEIIAKQPHVAYKVDDCEPYCQDADQVVFGPYEKRPGVRLAFVIKDGALIELYEKKEA